MRLDRTRLACTSSDKMLPLGSNSHSRQEPIPRRVGKGRLHQAQGLLTTGVLLLTACGAPEDGSLDTIGALQGAATTDLTSQWQPFTKDALWNLKLSPTRSETALPSAGLAAGAMAASDADYGIKVYFAKSTDPVLKISFSGYNTVLDVWNTASPAQIQGPANMVPPTGSDGSVILVDASKRYAYEMWQFSNTGNNTARATHIDVVDLASAGPHRNVGVTAAGLPGSGGLLKRYELSKGLPILHKLWAAVTPKMLAAGAIAPASSQDGHGDGAYPVLKYGDVIALTKTLNVESNDCNLSPFMKRIAHGLQDFGALVQDQGGDAIGFVSEVGAIKDYIDVDYNTTMWTMFGCLKKYMVKVNDPWTGATPGGLGAGGSGGGTPAGDTQPPTTPSSLAGTAPAATQAQLSWKASTDNVAVSGYRIYRNGAVLSTAAGTSFTDTSVSGGKTYTYNVAAYDGAGNQSAQSPAANVTTPTPPTSYPELLTNPGFESGTSPWSLQRWDGTSKLSRTTAQHRGGSYSVLIQNANNSSDGAVVLNSIAVTAGATYQLSAYEMLTSISSGASVLMIDWLSSRGSVVGTSTSGGKSLSSSWTQDTLTAVAPSGATRAVLYLFSYAVGSVYYDDVSFKRTR